MRFNSATKLPFRLFIVVSSSLTAIFRVEKVCSSLSGVLERDYYSFSRYFSVATSAIPSSSLPSHTAAIISPVCSSPLTEKKREILFYIHQHSTSTATEASPAHTRIAVFNHVDGHRKLTGCLAATAAAALGYMLLGFSGWFRGGSTVMSVRRWRLFHCQLGSGKNEIFRSFPSLSRYWQYSKCVICLYSTYKFIQLGWLHSRLCSLVFIYVRYRAELFCNLTPN